MKSRVLVLMAALLAAAALAPGSSLTAQSKTEMVKRGMAAYRALEFDAAAALLRLSLTGPDGAAFPDDVRAETYTYLGATEYFRGRADSSVAAFRAALIADPLQRPDSLVFPPAVTDAFDAVRKRSVYVRFSAARDTTIPFGEGLYAVRLYASAPHEVTVDLTSEDGRAARHLYSGPIADSLDIHWEGLDPKNEAPLDGPAALMVRSRSSWGEQRVMRLPLRAELIRKDTLPYPPAPADSSALPEQRSAGPAVGALAAGVLGVAAALALPAVVSDAGDAQSARLLVGGALGAAGVVGFVAKLPGRSISRNVAYNKARRDAWNRQVESIRRENLKRMDAVKLRIIAGRETALEGEAP